MAGKQVLMAALPWLSLVSLKPLPLIRISLPLSALSDNKGLMYNLTLEGTKITPVTN